MSESATLFSATLLSALMMGFSCGTGCSPAISTFLSTYVLHAEGDTKKSVSAFLSFFFGKALAVLLVCLIASLAGKAIVETSGYFGKYEIAFLMPLFLILSGAYMLKKCISEYRNKGCASCSSCSHCDRDHIQAATPLIGGLIYGLTPCAPLVLLAGYSVTMSMPESFLLGTVFSAACTLSPLILMLIFMKLIASKMIQEIPELFNVIKLLMSAAVLLIGIVTLIQVFI